MKQFFQDLGFVIVDLLESIGELIVYNIMAVRWIYEDVRDEIVNIYDAIRNGGLDDN